MTRARRGPWLLAAGALASLLATLALWSAVDGPRAAPAAGPEGPTDAPDDTAAALPEPARELQRPGEARAARAGHGDPRDADAGEPDGVPGPCALQLAFVDPARGALRLPLGRVHVTWPGGARELDVRNADGARFDGLPALAVEITVEAAGHVHRPQAFTLRAEQPEAEERLFLWPEGWIAVVVLAEDGRPFEALAEQLAIEPKRLFVKAFDVRARRAAPAPGDEAGDAEPPSHFEVPRSHHAWGLPGSAVGALRRLDPAPHWVGLVVYGELLAWEHLPAGATEVRFTLRPADLEARFVAVSLRVVDATGAPVAGARATLKADNSAHRRAEQMEVPSGADGRVAFPPAVPGEYEVLVELESALAQQRLELSAGERHDLGDVVLAGGARIPLRVVDEVGEPAQAWIEVGPLVPGGYAEDLYPPNLHRHTDSDGRFELQFPSSPSIVRASAMDPRSGMQLGVRSANAPVDPERPPAGELVLVVARPRALDLELTDDRAARLEVVDDLGVLVAASHLEGRRELRVELPPGDYVARLLDAERRQLASADLALRDEPLRVRLP